MSTTKTKLIYDGVAWKAVVFKECEVHTMLRYTCERCPVCVIIEDRDKALALKDETISTLEGVVCDLEGRADDYRRELGL